MRQIASGKTRITVMGSYICATVQHGRTSPIQYMVRVCGLSNLPEKITAGKSNCKYFFINFVKTRRIFSNLIIILNAKKTVLNIILVTGDK